MTPRPGPARAALLLVASACIPLGCGSSGSAATSASAPASAAALSVPVALPVAPFAYYALGDSITQGRQAHVKYPTVLAKALGAAPLANLAINAEPATKLVTDELPQVVAPCGLATLYIGLNDAFYIMQKVETPGEFRTAMTTIVSTLRKRCTVVAIATIVSNPNAFEQTYGAPYVAQLAAENAQIETFTSLSGVRIVPLDADSELHNLSDYNSLPANLYFVHPNDAGQERIAADFETALR